MSQDQITGDSAAPYVQLFQKAHQRIVMLERLEEQVQQIQTKRLELQDELRSIQSQLNEEFDTRIRSASPAANMEIRPSMSINSEPKRNRFAAQTIDSTDEAQVALG